MREIVHLQAGQCGNQVGAKVGGHFHFFCKILLQVFFRKFKIFVCVKLEKMETKVVLSIQFQIVSNFLWRNLRKIFIHEKFLLKFFASNSYQILFIFPG